MTHKQLIIEISKATMLDIVTCENVINSFIEISKRKIQDCKKLKIKNFGTVSSYVRPERRMKSFGNMIETHTKLVVKFKPSKNFVSNNKMADILEMI